MISLASRLKRNRPPDIAGVVDTLCVEAAKARSKERERADRALRSGVPYFHPSSLGKCLRAIYFSMVERREEVLAPVLSRVFSNGDYMHTRYQTLMFDAGVLAGGYRCLRCRGTSKVVGLKPDECPRCKSKRVEFAEVPFVNHELRIAFKPDGFFVHESRMYIVDYKSISMFGFKKLPKEPIQKHARQINLYIGQLINAMAIEDKGCVFYEDKNGQLIYPHWHEFDEAMYEDDLGDIAHVIECVDRERPPRKVVGGGQCRGCEYAETC